MALLRLSLAVLTFVAASEAPKEEKEAEVSISPLVHFALRDLTLLLHQLSTPLLFKQNALLFNWGSVHAASIRSIPMRRTVAGVELNGEHVLVGAGATNVCTQWRPPISCLGGMSSECLSDSLSRWGGDERDIFLSDRLGIGHVRVPARATVSQLRALAVEIGCNPFVEDISSDAIVSKAESTSRRLGRSPTPNDTQYSKQWHIKDQKIPDAWSITKGDKGIKIMVIDTGVDVNHPDIKDNMWDNSKEQDNFNNDADGNGYKGDKHGINASAGTGDCTDSDGHGTHMAGIVGAVTNNHVGVAGINWSPDVICCKFMGQGTKGLMSDAAKCLDYAVEVNVDVATASWGGSQEIPQLKKAIQSAAKHDILFVTAAGNNKRDIDQQHSYPASYTDLDNMVVVTGYDEDQKLISGGNWGAQSVHVGAPGDYIYSLGKDNSYAYRGGTSSATPNIAGLAALCLAANSNLTYKKVITNLKNSVEAVADLKGKTIWGGKINALKLVKACKSGS